MRGWRTDPMPMDGTPIRRRVENVYRFQPYSPKSVQFRNGAKGRWQEMNEYGGWENCEFPLGNEWAALSPPDHPAAGENE